MTIAVVKLAPGQAGFYDEISGIHLSLTNTEQKVSSNVKTTGLVEAVKAGKILIVSGSLQPETLLYKEATAAIPTYYRLLDKKRKKMIKENSVKTMISEQVEKIIKPQEKKVEKHVEVEIETTINEEVVETKVEETIEEIAEEIEKVEEVVEEKVTTKKETSTKKKSATKKK